ncbi:MAG: MaoC family dehydratase [Gammaproteobacteria bacterium]|nr:MaoC family dehydratase [Gammaproteobacteria bacterium]
MKTLTKENISTILGYQATHSLWFKIDQGRIDAFAGATLDRQFIHVDPSKAKHTPFGGTVAHGLLIISLLPYLVGESLTNTKGADMVLNYGYDKVRFISPVKVGSEVRALCKVVEVYEKNPGQFVLKLDVTIEVKGEEKPALVIEWLVMQVFLTDD